MVLYKLSLLDGITILNMPLKPMVTTSNSIYRTSPRGLKRTWHPYASRFKNIRYSSIHIPDLNSPTFH